MMNFVRFMEWKLHILNSLSVLISIFSFSFIWCLNVLRAHKRLNPIRVIYMHSINLFVMGEWWIYMLCIEKKFQFIRYTFDLQNYLWTIQAIDGLSSWIFVIHNTRTATISIATIHWTLLWNNWMWWWWIIDAMTLTVLTLCWWS